MKKAIRPAIFKWRQTEPELILCAVRWYLRYSLSFRDVEEMLSERGLEADHTTIWRWVQRYGPELEERLRLHPWVCFPVSLPPQGIESQLLPLHRIIRCTLHSPCEHSLGRLDAPWLQYRGPACWLRE